MGSPIVIEGSVSSRNPGEHPRVGPGRLGHEVKQRLVLAETREGAVTAASGSTLLHSARVSRPVQ